MHTLLFQPHHLNSAAPGLDFALTLAALEQTTNIVFLSKIEAQTAYDESLDQEIKEKLELLTGLDEVHLYEIESLKDGQSDSNDEISGGALRIQTLQKINEEALRQLMIKSQTIYNF